LRFAVEWQQFAPVLGQLSALGGGMARRETLVGPQLETLLDERDHLRIKINLAEGNAATAADVADMRRRLVELDREILKRWQSPSA
jgi:hypothetical protein